MPSKAKDDLATGNTSYVYAVLEEFNVMTHKRIKEGNVQFTNHTVRERYRYYRYLVREYEVDPYKREEHEPKTSCQKHNC